MLMVALRIALAATMFLVILWLDLGHKERAYLYEVAQQAAQSPKPKKKKKGKKKGDTAVLGTAVVQADPPEGISPWSSIGLAALVATACMTPGWRFPVPWDIVAYWAAVVLTVAFALVCAFGHYGRTIEGIIGILVPMATIVIVSWGDGDLVLSLIIPLILSVVSIAIVIVANTMENPTTTRKEDEANEPVGGFILPTLAGLSGVATFILGVVAAVIR